LGEITPRTAVAVRRALGDCCGLWPEIKWVNDLQWQGRKLCGILCEAVLLGGRAESLVIGVGVNVHTPPEAFPPALRAKAASLGDFCRPPEKTRLAAELLLALDGLARQQPAERAAYWEEYRACCVTLGKTVTLPDGREALAEGLGEDFALLLRLPDGSRLRLQSGEATLHGE
jgi:BirA family biotin operon repressor/biotin-[acetyl-CoA-carboxylase] ligase